MNGKVRPALFLVGAVGFVCLGYAFAFGLEHGFSLSWEGNWDPVVVGLVGVALLAAAATADVTLKRARGKRGLSLARDVVRTVTEASLTFIQYAGVCFVVWGFVLCLSFARADKDATMPLVVALAGIALNRLGAFFLPRVRERRAKKETFVSSMEDDHEP